MDKLEFVSTMAGNIAWPLSFFGTALIFRKQLYKLMERMTKVEVLGSSAEFGKELSETIVAAELIQRAPAPKGLGVKRRVKSSKEPTDSYLKLANLEPSAAVMEAYKKIEAVLNDWSDASGMTHPPSNEYLVKWLVEDNMLTKEQQDLYQKVRQMRNAAIHAPSGNITVGEAIAFRDLSNKMAVYLEDALSEFNKKRAKG